MENSIIIHFNVPYRGYNAGEKCSFPESIAKVYLNMKATTREGKVVPLAVRSGTFMDRVAVLKDVVKSKSEPKEVVKEEPVEEPVEEPKPKGSKKLFK